MTRVRLYEGDAHQNNGDHPAWSPIGRTYDTATPPAADQVVEHVEIGEPYGVKGFSMQSLGVTAELPISFNGAGPVPIKNELPQPHDVQIEHV